MPLVLFDRVSREYRVGKIRVRAVRQLSFVIEKGEFTVFWGPSGSGKTTTLNLLGSLDEPTSGRVLVEDCDVTALSDNRKSDFRNRNIGFVFQEFNLLLVLSALENVMLPLELRGVSRNRARVRALECLKAVGLEPHASHLPAQLSGGEKQRVAIARAMVTGPSLIVADEPTANLDTENALNVIEIMKALNENHGVTFIFSTHDQRLLHYAKRRMKLVDGQLDRDEPAPRAGEHRPGQGLESKTVSGCQ